MLKLLNSLFPQTETVDVTTNQVCGLNVENPKIAELRAQAKAKMKEWGRKSLLEGGDFDRNNVVLTPRLSRATVEGYRLMNSLK